MAVETGPSCARLLIATAASEGALKVDAVAA